MTVNVNNVIVGEAQVYYAPYGLTTPGEPEPAPSDLLPYGTPWGGNWQAIGATFEGVTLSYDPRPNPLYIEEQPNPAAVPIDTSDVTVNFTLSEDVLQNMLLAWGAGAVVTQAAGANQIGKSTYNPGIVLNPYTFGFEAAVSGTTTPSAGRSTTGTASWALNGTTLTDTGGAFTDADYGRTVTATGIPAGTVIIGVTSATVVELSNLATAAGTSANVTYGAKGAVPYFRRVYVPKCLTGQAKIDTTYRRAKDYRKYAVTAQSINPIEQIAVWDQTAEVTGS